MGAALVALLVAVAPIEAAHAHHTAGASRVAAGAGTWGRGPAGGGGATPGGAVWWGARYEWTRFDRVLRGADPYPAAGDPRVDTHTLRLELGAQLATQTWFGLEVPLTVLDAAGEGADSPRAGVGDLELWVGQDFGAFYAADASPLWPRVWLDVGVVAPTGAFDEDSVALATELGGSAQQIQLTTHDMRTSLGAGAWWWRAGCSLTWSVGDGWQLYLAGALRGPFESAPDGTLWGLVTRAEAGAWARVIPDWLDLGAAVAYAGRGPDDRPTVSLQAAADPPADAPEGTAATGGIDALALAATAQLDLGRGIRTWLRADVPVTQHVRGVQLVDSVSLSVGLRGILPW